MTEDGGATTKPEFMVAIGWVFGLKKFDASGRFKGKLPREQLLLVLWINDPAERNAKAVMKWVEK